MKKLLTEIKELAQKGMENTVISNDNLNKELFLNIMLKSEVALNKLNQNVGNAAYEGSRTYEKIDDDLKSNMYVVGYCFSNYEHMSLYPELSQDKAFIIAAEKLGVKKNTLKNVRDWFDGHNDSHRSGWWQQELPEDMQKFKEIYDKKDKGSILKEAREILEINEIYENKMQDFGLKLKNDRFHGKFRKKDEVEEFIQIVLKNSSNVVKDFVEQCSKRTFKMCYEYFAEHYTDSLDSLSAAIVKFDSRTAPNSDFSHWIRARFIQEIFKQGLEKDAYKIVNK